MVFSSTVFLFLFLPFTLIIYYLLPGRSNGPRNYFLFLMSLVFYAWGEPRFVLVMLAIVLINYLIAFYADRVRRNADEAGKRRVVVLTVLTNLSVLFVFKYLNFTIENINLLFQRPVIPQTHIVLPIGVSFITFQAMSYVFDVLQNAGELQHNPMCVGLYISLFPQLIAGPIVRYRTVAEEIKSRKVTLHDFSEGVDRFIFGLGKKVLIANSVAVLADRSFNAISEMSPTTAWIGAIAYSLQIYFDFSAYSDMAIGLGRMLGFHFLENFNYPYVSGTVTDFWRRWHIFLGTWFRDYVYIPLGGSRKGQKTTVRNLFIVWLLTGIWHGANWTFICWGLLYFVVLSFEKLIGITKWVSSPDKRLSAGALLYRLATLFIIICGWILFRSDSITDAFHYLQTLFTISPLSASDSFLLGQNWLLLCIGAFFSFPIIPSLRGFLKHAFPVHGPIVCGCFHVVFMCFVGVLSIIAVVSSTYNPFIYFNF